MLILPGMVTGLPPGRYCDLASLTTQRCWDRRWSSVAFGKFGKLVVVKPPLFNIPNLFEVFTLPETNIAPKNDGFQ